MFSDILGYKIFRGSKDEFINYIKGYAKIHIISGNPEILYNALFNAKLHENFISDKSIIIPDGIGTVMASKIVGQRVKEKIAGIEVMDELLSFCEKEALGVYFVGAKEDILQKCLTNLIIKYPKLKICGSHNGYFDIENCEDIIMNISNSSPYILFSAMGSPRQEMFIIKYMDILPCSIYMGVGGSLDVIAGNVKRAPKWMIKIGMEWLYRVIKEPWRAKRLFSIPKFLVKVVVEQKKSMNK